MFQTKLLLTAQNNLSSVPNNVPSNGTNPSVKCSKQWPF